MLLGGREAVRIEIVDYDPRWPDRYRSERTRIAAALGETAVRIEHIGSTSVQGLAAKPIIDVLVTVRDPDTEEDFAPALEAAGYQLRVREPGHRMFRTPGRDVHVHVWADDDPEVARCLAFRDRLRVSEADRTAYERLKRALAERGWADMNHYADAKTGLIAEILGRSPR